MRRLLVTGGAGFIGSNFVDHWLGAYPRDRVVVLDALTYAGNPANLADACEREAFRFVRGDVADTALVETLLREEALDTVVHFAAESHVDRSISGPDAVIATNIVGTHSLLKAARRVWIERSAVPDHRFHHISTDEVFGSLADGEAASTETSAFAPNSPYSASKAAADHLVRAYHRTYGLRASISNCSNNYGPRQFPEKLIPLTIVNILRGRPVTLYGDGRNVRDWLHVADHCHGIELALTRGKAGEVYNFGGDSPLENVTLVQRLCAMVDARFEARPELAARFPEAPPARGRESSSLVTYVEDRAGHDRRYAIDCTKARRELGYQVRQTLADGLGDTLDWYLAREDWWRAVLERRHPAATV
jgi:dTDP-glucose 4,6-dehydratase